MRSVRATFFTAVVALVLLAGCKDETEPATNVTDTSAQLNYKAECGTDTYGRYWMEIRQQLGQGGFFQVGDAVSFDCPPDQNPDVEGYQWGQAPLNLSVQATGLRPSTGYDFRLAVDLERPGGPLHYADADGNNEGGYDEFRTLDRPPGRRAR